jgi:hypothetical protein
MGNFGVVQFFHPDLHIRAFPNQHTNDAHMSVLRCPMQWSLLIEPSGVDVDPSLQKKADNSDMPIFSGLMQWRL